MSIVARAFAAVALIACRTPRPIENVATPSAGVSIAIYQLGESSYAVVDDRRWVEVADGTLTLDHIDPGAALPSLVIEPLGGSKLAVGQCTRDVVSYGPSSKKPELEAEVRERRRRMIEGIEGFDDENEDEPAKDMATVVSSVVCAVIGSGRHLVRVLYVSSTITYRAKHEVKMTAPEHASLVSLFSIVTPNWGGKAEVTLFDGMPGNDKSPEEIVRGTIHLDGTTAVIAPPVRDTPAKLTRVFSEQRPDDDDEEDYGFGGGAGTSVWVWLELPLAQLPAGPIHISVAMPGEEPQDVDVPVAQREQGKTELRLRLWIDYMLRGMRARYAVGSGDRYVMSVANNGSTTREVWVEQKLRLARRREVKNAWPMKPEITNGVARSKLVLKPDTIERLGYVVEYAF